MAGHSHWKNIKRTKELSDKARASSFAKISRAISLAVKEKGSNIESNHSLKILIEKAKNNNMPKDKIEKAIKGGSGEIKGENLEEFIFEAYGLDRVAFIVEGITDNKNRSLTNFKTIISKYNSKFAESGSVRWMFEKKGEIKITTNKNIDETEIIIINSGADGYKINNEEIFVYTKIEDLDKIKIYLEKNNLNIEELSISWLSLNQIEIDNKNNEICEKMFSELDESEDIQNIYSNIKNDSFRN